MLNRAGVKGFKQKVFFDKYSSMYTHFRTPVWLDLINLGNIVKSPDIFIDLFVHV